MPTNFRTGRGEAQTIYSLLETRMIGLLFSLLSKKMYVKLSVDKNHMHHDILIINYPCIVESLTLRMVENSIFSDMMQDNYKLHSLQLQEHKYLISSFGSQIGLLSKKCSIGLIVYWSKYEHRSLFVWHRSIDLYFC